MLIHTPATSAQREEAYKYFSLDPTLPTILVVGGSLGCGTLNRTMKKWILEGGSNAKFQVIWQSGKGYAEGINTFFQGLEGATLGENSRVWNNVHNCDFISRMDLAYAACDLIVSRAGAGTISELCAAGKASIFVPSPVVAEDHQTHNAMALVRKGAALLIKDAEAEERLMAEVEKLAFDRARIKELETNILALAKPNASSDIADEVLKLAR